MLQIVQQAATLFKDTNNWNTFYFTTQTPSPVNGRIYFFCLVRLVAITLGHGKEEEGVAQTIRIHI